MNTHSLSLDLDKRGEVAQWITLRQGDRNGTQLQATIYDHGVQVGSGYTCRVVIRRPDVAEYYRETCEYSLGVATVTIDEQYAAAISGSTYGYFELLQGGSVIASTESFGVRILPDATADATVGPEYDSAIEDALAELDEATGRISQMVVDATEEYLEAHPELTTTVEDNSLTDAKLIQSGGILDRVARLWHRLDNLLTATPAESDALTVTDAAKTPMAGLALYGRSTQDGTPTPSAPVPIVSVEGNLVRTDVYANTSGSVPSTAWADHTTAGITWTRNADGSLTARGTATGNSTCYLVLDHEVPAGTQLGIRGCPAGDSGSTWRMLLCSTDNTNLSMMTDNGSGALGTISKAANRVRVMVYSGAANVDVTFMPSLFVRTQALAPAPFGNVALRSMRTSDTSQQSVTPIDLQGHALRSLPDGTRDEVTVDQYGHAALTQRVGEMELPTTGWTANTSRGENVFYHAVTGHQYNPSLLDRFAPASSVSELVGTTGMAAYGGYNSNTGTTAINMSFPSGVNTVALAQQWLTDNPTTLLYALATPVTIDLGTVDPVALQGPDMTAQAVPTAPFALTYERDLNVTLSRLEASIAELATN